MGTSRGAAWIAAVVLTICCALGGAAWGGQYWTPPDVVNSHLWNNYTTPINVDNEFTPGQNQINSILSSGVVGASYIQNGNVYHFGYYTEGFSNPGYTTYHFAWYTTPVAPQHVIDLESNGRVRNGTTLIGTGGGNTFNMNQAGAMIGDGGAATVTLDGTGNTFNMNIGQITTGSSMNIHQGTVNLNGGSVDGSVTTDTNNSLWNINGTQMTANSTLSTTGAGDTFIIGNGSSFDVNSEINANTTGGNTFTILNTAAANTFTTGGGIDATATAAGAVNTFNLNGGGFASTSGITSTASQNNFYLHGTSFASTASSVESNGNTYFEMTTGQFNGTLDINGATQQIVNISGNSIVGNNAALATIDGDNNTLSIFGSANVSKNFAITGDNNALLVYGNSIYSGANTIVGDNNIIDIYQNANFSGSSTVTGNNSNVHVGITGTMSGYVDLAASGGTNNVVLDSGNLTRAATQGSIHGSDVVGALTNITLNGVRAQQVYGGSADTNAYLNNFAVRTAVIKNLNMNNRTSLNNVIPPATSENVFVNGVFRKSSNNTNMNTLVNAGTIDTVSGSYLEIGSLNLSNLGIGTEVSQLTTDTLNVAKNSKFVIHEDISNNGMTTPRSGGLENIINNLNINGTANINQTTIQGSTPGGALITVNAGGMLHGFGQLDAGNNPMRANLVGDLIVKGGGTLKPYDSEVYKIVNQQLKGVTFRVDAAGGAGGLSTFEQASILSTRVFAIPDSRSANVGGDVKRTSYSDSIKSVNFDFSSVYNGGVEVPQAAKVQYDPVFGFQYELVSKQQFDVYKGDGVHDATYYYHVAMSDTALAELASRPNANHLFNKDIIKSDMLGEWWFEKTTDNKGVVLRFRLLAEHPTKGGIAKDAMTPNSREAATVIDTWRYPFQTAYNKHLNLPVDPSAGNGYNVAGYNGNMNEYYAANAHLYPKYNPEYIRDFEHLLLSMQNEAISGIDLERALRQLHAEPYADTVDVNLGTMRSFTDLIERNMVSASYQVESDSYDAVASRIEGNSDAFANIDVSCADEYVCNPIRFWAGGFGSKGDQDMIDTEYGFNADRWGGAVGAIKEFGDLYVGVTGGYARVNNDWDDLNAHIKTDSYLAEARVGYRCGMGFAEIYGNFGYNENLMQRNIRIATYYGDATGDYNDYIYGGGVRVGYNYLMGGNWLLTPTIALNYQKAENEAFDETGRANMSTLLQFKKGGITRQNVTAPMMLRLNRPFAFLGCFVLTPEIRAGFTPIFGNKHASATAEFVGMPIPDQTFTSIGINPGRYYGQVGGTLELSRRGKFYLAGNYDYFFRKQGYEHNYSVQAGLNF